MIDPGDPASVAEFVRACGLAVVATVSAEQRPEAALLGVAAMDDGTLVVDTFHHSRKVENLSGNSNVAVVVGLSDDVTVQLEGIAEIATGEARQRYGAAYNEQLPGSRALDDGFDVVVIRPTWVRVYDTGTEPPVVTEARWT